METRAETNGSPSGFVPVAAGTCSEGWPLPHYFVLSSEVVDKGLLRLFSSTRCIVAPPCTTPTAASLINGTTADAEEPPPQQTPLERSVSRLLASEGVTVVCEPPSYPGDSRGLDNRGDERLGVEYFDHGPFWEAADTLAERCVSSLLLSGPPGSGKSSLLSAYLTHWATQNGTIGLRVSCAALGGAGETVPYSAVERVLFLVLREAMRRGGRHGHGGSVAVVLDDLDVLCPVVEEESPHYGVAEERSVHLSAALCDWLTAMHFAAKQCRATGEEPPILIATVQSPSSLNKVLRSPLTFEAFADIAPTDEASRTTMLTNILAVTTPHQAANIAVGTELTSESGRRWVAEQTDGFVIADLRALVNTAVEEASRSGDRCVGREHVEAALESVTPRALQGQDFLKSAIGWHDIGGMTEAKQVLSDLLTLPHRFKVLFEQAPIPVKQGAILIGPPGCGKTLLAHAAAQECGLRVIGVKGPELLSKYIGGSEAAIRGVFDRAMRAAPAMIFFDELEALAPRRGADSTGVTDRVVNQLLCYLDGVEDRQGVAVLAATSRPDLVDPALLRPGRLEKVIYCGLPDAAERLDILQKATQRLHLASDVDLSAVGGELPPHATGADIQALVNTAQIHALHDDSTHVTATHLHAAAQETQPSLSTRDLEHYVRLYVPFLSQHDIDNLGGKSGGPPAMATGPQGDRNEEQERQRVALA